jgi:glycosyltransferase involved in cell wall biosynthesis
MLFHKPLCYWDYYCRSLKLVAQEPADIYHAHDLNTLPVAYWAVRRYGGKLLYDSHELYTETSNLSRTERAVSRLFESFLIRRCSAVITVNSSIAEELAARYGISRPAVVMNCPIQPNYVSENDILRAKLGLQKEDLLVLYQGGFSPHRGLENLIAAIAMLPQARLVMMGWGRLEEDLRALADAMGLLGKRIFFLPPVPQDELLLWTASADVGVIPYRNVGLNNYYSLPNKLFEYIAAGIPVVASDFPELRRVIEEFKVGCTFNPDDPKDIARAINWILEDEQRLVELKANARKAAAVLNWDNEEKKLLAIYKRLTK